MKKLILIVLLLISTSAFAASINAAAYRTMQMQSYQRSRARCSHKGRYRTGRLNQITQLETGCIPVTRSQKQIIIINTTGADNAKL